MDTMRWWGVWALCAAVACGNEDNPASTEPSGTGAGAAAGSGGQNAGGDPGAGGGDVAVEALADGSFVCRPNGTGPFPCVLYNHGGKGTAVGGDLAGTCEALAEAGFLARSEKRPETVPLDGHLEDVLAALAALRSDVACDETRVGMLGFSRGGLLTLQAGLAVPDDVHALILLAPASGNGALEQALADVSALTAPVSIHVAENDLVQDDHVLLAHQVEDALVAAGKQSELTVHPPFGDDGHELFFEVQEPYWSGVLLFFATTLGR